MNIEIQPILRSFSIKPIREQSHYYSSHATKQDCTSRAGGTIDCIVIHALRLRLMPQSWANATIPWLSLQVERMLTRSRQHTMIRAENSPLCMSELSAIGECERRSRSEPGLRVPKNVLEARYTRQLSLLSVACSVMLRNGPEAALHEGPRQSRSWQSKGCQFYI